MYKKIGTLLLVVITIFTICFFTSCSAEKDAVGAEISFINDSGLELSIGVKKSVVERALHCSFENDEYYALEDKHCGLGFVDNELVYAEFDSPWKISKGLQFDDKMANLIADLGEPEDIASEEDGTAIYRIDYVFGNTKVSYHCDDVHYQDIALVLCVDINADISKIEASRNDYYRALIDEALSLRPIKACHGYDERMNWPEESAELMREIMGEPYIELDIGTDKLVYEDLLGQNFEDGKYYRISDPECILYFESGKLALFGIGESWYWGDGQLPKVESGQLMTDTLEVYGNPIAQESNGNGDISELVFELKNGQRIGYKALKNGKQIQFIYVIDASTDIYSLPEM